MNSHLRSGILVLPAMMVLACGSPGQGADPTPDGAAHHSDGPNAPDAAIGDAAVKTCNGQVADRSSPATGCAAASCEACVLPATATATSCTVDGACDFTCPAGTNKTATSCDPPPPQQASLISAGTAFSCAVTANKRVKCWGANDLGRLGNGTTIESHVAVDVVGLSDVRAISSGGAHTCVLTETGAAKCWGYNGEGNLGNGQNGNPLMPVDVTGLGAGTAAIAAGGLHTCAITATGGVKCWGSNFKGELGTAPSLRYSNVPIDVVGISSGAIAIASGFYHSCAVLNTGRVKCWGENKHGQLGNNTRVDSPTPVDVIGVTDATAIVAGGETTYGRSHTCVLTSSGGVKCWGNHGFGQLGTGGLESDSPVAVGVLGLASGVTQISAGQLNVLAVTTTHSVKGWGDGSQRQLGSATTVESLRPLNIPGLETGITAAAAGAAHSCFITTAGGVKCFGTNYHGEIGNNTTTHSVTPVDVVGF